MAARHPLAGRQVAAAPCRRELVQQSNLLTSDKVAAMFVFHPVSPPLVTRTEVTYPPEKPHPGPCGSGSGDSVDVAAVLTPSKCLTPSSIVLLRGWDSRAWRSGPLNMVGSNVGYWRALIV
jgi:hypothetical protein